MRRRALLSTLAAGITALGGCTVPGTSSADPEKQTTVRTATDHPTGAVDSPTATDSEPTPIESDGYADVVDLQTATRTYALFPTRYRTDDGGVVTVQFRQTATADHPATVTATLQNDNEFANTFPLSWLPPFGRFASDEPRPFHRRYYGDRTYRDGLLLVPTGDSDRVDSPPALERDEDGLWRLAESPGRTEMGPETYRLEAGETLASEFALVGHPNGAGQGRVTGVYEFTGRDDVGLTVAVWDTAQPGPDAESRFAGTDLPPFGDGPARTAWYHDTDATTAAYVRPETEHARLPEQIRFTFVNKSRRLAKCGHWDLYKLVDGQWFHIGPYVHTSDCRYAYPGETVHWTLNAYPGEALPAGPEYESIGYLGGGRYAVVAGYGHETPQSGALVDFRGPPVEIEPTDGVTTTRDGAEVTVTSPRLGDEPSERAALAVEQDVAGTDGRRLVPEQVMRHRNLGLRNTLPFLEAGVERVVLRTDESVADRVVGYDAERTTITVAGTSYNVRLDRDV